MTQIAVEEQERGGAAGSRSWMREKVKWLVRLKGPMSHRPHVQLSLLGRAEYGFRA
jgi:hypothetical protein